MHSESDKSAILNFKDFLKIKSISSRGHIDGTYLEAVDFLVSISDKYGLLHRQLKIKDSNVVLIVTLLGKYPELPSILFNCHYDVVPVVESKWSFPPFSGQMDDNGNIYGRGAQDMKCVGIQVLEALKRIGHKNLSRNVHLTFVPDEEIGSEFGMEKFCKTEFFKDLNVLAAFDEGIPSQTGDFLAFNGERAPWWIKISIEGKSGHGSSIQKHSALHAATKLASQIVQFNENLIEDLRKSNKSLGEVTTINLSEMHTSLDPNAILTCPPNVIPPFAELVLDVRISPVLGEDSFVKKFTEWLKVINEGDFDINVHYLKKERVTPITATSVDCCEKFKKVFKEMNKECLFGIFQGSTDARFLRAMGVPVIGFSPIINTEMRLHDHDEYLNVETFLEGIKVYERIMRKMAL